MHLLRILVSPLVLAYQSIPALLDLIAEQAGY